MTRRFTAKQKDLILVAASQQLLTVAAIFASTDDECDLEDAMENALALYDKLEETLDNE